MYKYILTCEVKLRNSPETLKLHMSKDTNPQTVLQKFKFDTKKINKSPSIHV